MSIVVTEHKATVQVTLPQLVHCTHCDRKFVYEMTVTGDGRATDVTLGGQDEVGRTRAEQRARADLETGLNDYARYEAIPCPECFHYQPYMYQRVGYGRYDSLGCTGYLLAPLGGMLFLGAGATCAFLRENRLIFGYIALFGLVVWAAGYLALRRRNRLVSRYNPNTERLEERKHVAQARAVPLDEFATRQAARVRDAVGEERARLAAPDSPITPVVRSEPLVVEWWVTPSVLINGGTVFIPLPDSGTVEVVVPEDTAEGAVLDARPASAGTALFKVRVFGMRVHPDEMRLD